MKKLLFLFFFLIPNICYANNLAMDMMTSPAHIWYPGNVYHYLLYSDSDSQAREERIPERYIEYVLHCTYCDTTWRECSLECNYHFPYTVAGKGTYRCPYCNRKDSYEVTKRNLIIK